MSACQEEEKKYSLLNWAFDELLSLWEVNIFISALIEHLFLSSYDIKERLKIHNMDDWINMDD